MSDSLKGKTISGLSWSLFQRFGQHGVQFFISIILARLLLPEQFGLIAMVTIFLAIAQVLIDSGFGSALIQKQDADFTDECSVFYLNLILSAVVVGLLFLGAPWIADFYKAPILVPLTRLMSLNLIINAFGLIQKSLLTKRIDFKSQMKAGIAAIVISGVIGVTMAYNGFGVWSLVVQSICGNTIRVAYFWMTHSWRPAWRFSVNSIRTMFAFGSKLLLIGLLDRIFKNLYLIVIGKVFSPADLGFYSRALSIQQLPVKDIGISSDLVTFPVFAAVQDDKPRLKRGVRKALMMQAMLNFPMMIGLAVVARPLVQVLLTDKWLPCVPYLQLLCAVGMLFPLNVTNLSVLKAQGRSDLFLRIEVLKRILIVIAIFTTYRWGISAMIYGQIVTTCLAYYLNTYYTAKLIDYPISEQIMDILPSFGFACLMGGGIYFFRYAIFSNQLILLLIQILTGIAIYAFLCRIFRLSAFMELMEIVKPRLRMATASVRRSATH